MSSWTWGGLGEVSTLSLFSTIWWKVTNKSQKSEAVLGTKNHKIARHKNHDPLNQKSGVLGTQNGEAIPKSALKLGILGIHVVPSSWIYRSSVAIKDERMRFLLGCRRVTWSYERFVIYNNLEFDLMYHSAFVVELQSPTRVEVWGFAWLNFTSQNFNITTSWSHWNERKIRGWPWKP